MFFYLMNEPYKDIYFPGEMEKVNFKKTKTI